MTHYVVVYRMGGRQSFEWRRSLPLTKDEADKARNEVERGGRPAYVVNARLSESIGLPETFDAASR